MSLPKKSTPANLSALLDVLPPFLCRTHPKFRELTGLSSRSVANLDSLGEGPPERIMIGRTVAYPRESFVKWLETRSRVISGGER